MIIVIEKQFQIRTYEPDELRDDDDDDEDDDDEDDELELDDCRFVFCRGGVRERDERPRGGGGGRRRSSK